MKGAKTRDRSKWMRLIPFLVVSLVMSFMTVTAFAQPEEGDPFENVQFFELEQTTEGPRRVFDDGGLEFRLPDEARNVEGVTKYEGFVGIPGEDGWTELADCYNYDDTDKLITIVGQAIGNLYPG